MKVLCSCEDQWRPTVPGFNRVTEVDLQGRRAGTLCLMHPDVRQFWTALADRRPSDGYFVEFWRLLVEYPEIIGWDKLFDLGKHQVLTVAAALKAGADGVVLSRKYSEMRLENLSAAGRAVRDGVV